MRGYVGGSKFVGVPVTLDGVKYEVHYHGDQKHVRAYRFDGRTERKVKDKALVGRLVAEIQRKRTSQLVGIAPGTGKGHLPPMVATKVQPVD